MEGGVSTPADAIDSGADDSTPQGALATLQAPEVSSAGRAWGESYLKAHPEGVDTSGESALLQQQDADAQEARTALQKARERLASQRMDPSVLGLRFAQAMLSPSKYGIPDQWSKAAGSVADWRQQNQEFEQHQGEEDVGLAEKLSGVDKQSLAARLALQQLKERTQSSLLGTALKATAKPPGPVSAESPIGKMVEDRYGVGSLQTDAGKAAFDAYAAQKEADKNKGDFAPEDGELLAAMAVAGVSLPAGLRSKQQQAATLQGLRRANPGVSATDIAEMVRTGQLDFNGSKRSTGQLAGVLAAANAQSAQLEKNFAQLEPLVAQMPNAPNFINEALTGLKNNLSFGGSKDSAKFVLYLREAATEYAKLVSGSTGAAAPAEGNIKEAVGIFQKAYTEGGFQGLKEAITQSAQNKRDSYTEGLRTAAQRGLVTGTGKTTVTPPAAPAPVNAKGWVLHADKDGNKAYVSPDGKSYEEVK